MKTSISTYPTHWFAGAMASLTITYYARVFIGLFDVKLPIENDTWLTVLLLFTTLWAFRETLPLIASIARDIRAGKFWLDTIDKSELSAADYFRSEGVTINVSAYRSQYNRGGFVYLLMDMDVTGYCKIGKTKEPVDRIGHFDIKLPFETKVLHIIPCYDSTKTETVLHHRFADKRQRGEWFNLDQHDIEWIREIKTS